MKETTGEISDKKILIVEDDLFLNKLLALAFSRHKARVHTAANGQDGLRLFYTLQPDLVILDLMMPNTDGWEVCRQIRQMSDVPIIIVTALGQDNNVIRGLGCGADDYVTKPLNPDVLVARAQTVLRRRVIAPGTKKPTIYSDDYLKIELDKHMVLVRGKPTKLTAKEYRLLAYLLQNADRVVTFEQILEKVWGWEYRDSVDYVHVYISHLRRKLEPSPKRPKYLLTEHGLGYRFVKHSPKLI
jgi:two-component system KDP operon response regulator KdpE